MWRAFGPLAGGTPAFPGRPFQEQENVMDVKQAVQTAKEHVAHLFADEHISNVGLEEVEFSDFR